MSTHMDAHPPTLDSSTVGVIGAGVMGVGVSEALARGGYNVVLVDMSTSILGQAERKLSRSDKASRLLSHDNAPREYFLQRISYSTSYEPLHNAHFVIENVSETMEAKAEVYGLLDGICSPLTILAANTSTIPIAHIAQLCGNPQRLIGLHFMNPATTKPVVEVIKGCRTSQETISTSLSLLGTIGKRGVIVNDAPGFVSNRVLMLTINEAVRTIEEGTSCAADVDRIFVECFGHTMGPLATADLIGLDTIVLSLESLKHLLNDDKYEPVKLLRNLVSANKLGRKTGYGFFDYS